MAAAAIYRYSYANGICFTNDFDFSSPHFFSWGWARLVVAVRCQHEAFTGIQRERIDRAVRAGERGTWF